jgi:hypothetical protein
MLRAICPLLFFTEVSVVVLETRLSVELFLRVSFVPAITVVPAVNIYIFLCSLKLFKRSLNFS